MNELITTEGILKPDIATKVAFYEKELKSLKVQYDALKADIQTEMESRGIIKIDTPELLISYVAETDRESLDTKALKEECPEIYDAYAKMSPVKATIRIKTR